MSKYVYIKIQTEDFDKVFDILEDEIGLNYTCDDPLDMVIDNIIEEFEDKNILKDLFIPTNIKQDGEIYDCVKDNIIIDKDRIFGSLFNKCEELALEGKLDFDMIRGDC